MNNYTYPLVFVCLLFCTHPLLSLNPGAIMFVGFDADTPDGFAFVSLVDIPIGTVVSVFDNDGAGQIDWTTTAAVPGGTVVIFQSVQNSSATVNLGSINRTANFQINGDDEVLVAKEGSTCLAAIRNDVNTPISAGCSSLSSAFIVTSSLLDEDVMVYTGSTICDGTLSACQTMVANNNNWTTEDGSGDQSTDGVFPDFPANVPAEFSGSALPIALNSFYAESLENNISIRWSTLSETNCAYMSIEKLDSHGNFSLLGKVRCQENSVTEQYYHMTDPAPISGMNYYRLKQEDLDGSISFSKTVTVRFQVVEKVRISPTLATRFLDIEFLAVSEIKRELQVINLMGTIVMEVTIDAEKMREELDLSSLITGNYILIFNHGNAVETHRFSKF